MTADTAELMYATVGAYRHVICDLYVACKRGAVCENDVVADNAVMRHVRLCHEEVVVADTSQSASTGRASMHCDKLAKDISLTYYQACALSLELEVLWYLSETGEWEEAVSYTHLRAHE